MACRPREHLSKATFMIRSSSLTPWTGVLGSDLVLPVIEFKLLSSENEKAKVNQLDVGKKKDQHNNYKTRTCVRYKVKRQQNIAGNQNRNNQKGTSDRNHCVPRTSKNSKNKAIKMTNITLVYSRYPSVPMLRSLMFFVSLSVGSTINYYNLLASLRASA